MKIEFDTDINGYHEARKFQLLIDGMLANTVGIAIWPHHFDVGSFAIAAQDADGNMLNTVGFGLAPADDVIDEYYFYITTWAKAGDIDHSNAPKLPAGSWNHKAWNGDQ